MKLYCENELCIYQSEGECLLDYLELDPFGRCRECILISVDKEKLEALKTEKRENLDNE